jgi:hypothetical protein
MPLVKPHPFKARPNVVVLPLNIDPPTPQRSFSGHKASSRGKIQLVSPSKNRTSKENKAPTQPSSLASSHSSFVALGGKKSRNGSQHRSKEFLVSATSPKRSSCQMMSQTASVFRATTNLSQRGYQTQDLSGFSMSRPTSPSQRIYINNKLVENHQPSPKPVHQRITSEVTRFQPIHRVWSASQAATELAIKEENTFENLKDSYESDLQEIKQLQE